MKYDGGRFILCRFISAGTENLVSVDEKDRVIHNTILEQKKKTTGGWQRAETEPEVFPFQQDNNPKQRATMKQFR